MNAPTAERRQHDDIVLSPEQIADAYGLIGRPWRAETMLERLQRNGDIEPPERAAGDEFHRLFRLASLDPLRAADMTQPQRPQGSGGLVSERARHQVYVALNALGGQASPCGSCAWFMLGCELSIRQWAINRQLNPHAAKGVLLGTLGVLAKHFA